MRRGFQVLAVLAAVAAESSASPVRAQEGPGDVGSERQSAQLDDLARKWFAAGKAEYDAGQFDQALLHFQEAYAQSRRPELLYNVGLAAERLRYNTTALDAFERYLKELPDAANHGEVENRTRMLREVIEREAAAGLSPAAVARAARGSHASNGTPMPGSSRASERDDANGDGLFSQWWFWTAAGVVVAAAATGIVLATSGDTTAEPVAGTGGVVVVALTVQ